MGGDFAFPVPHERFGCGKAILYLNKNEETLKGRDLP
jgi:hypothetical protein